MALIGTGVFDAAAHQSYSPVLLPTSGASPLPPEKDPTDAAMASASPHPTSTATPSQTITPSATSSPTPTPLTGLTFAGSSYGCTSGPYVTCSATVTNTHTDPQRWDFDITFTYNDASTIFGSNFSLTLAFTTGVFNTNVPIWWEMYPTANEVMPNRWIDVQYPTVPDLNPMPYPSGSWTVGGQPSPYQTFWINFSRDTGDTETLVRTDSWHVTIATYEFQSLTPTPTATLTNTPTDIPTVAADCQTFGWYFSDTDLKFMPVFGAKASINTEIPALCGGPYSSSSAWAMIVGGDGIADYAQVGYIQEAGDSAIRYWAEYSTHLSQYPIRRFGEVASGTHTYLAQYNFSDGKIYMYVGNTDGSYTLLAITEFSVDTFWLPGRSPEWNGETHYQADDIPGTFANPVYFSNLRIIASRDGPWVTPSELAGGSTSSHYGFEWDIINDTFHIWTK